MRENSPTPRDKILSQLSRTESARPTIWSEAAQPGDLIEQFCERFRALGGEIKTLSEFIHFSGICFLDHDVYVSGIETTTDIWTAETGVTRAEFAIAETGSVVIKSSPSHFRLASLAPPRHVVLLNRSKVVANVSQAFDQMPESNVAVITGPSRTADIEGVLVRGVHGPKQIWIVFDEEGS